MFTNKRGHYFVVINKIMFAMNHTLCVHSQSNCSIPYAGIIRIRFYGYDLSRMAPLWDATNL